MKKILIAILILAITSCNDFLEEYSQNEIRPSLADDLQQILIGEVYPLHTTFLEYLDLLTDDVESNFDPLNINYQDIYNRYYTAFTWQKDMFERMEEFVGNSDYHIYDTYEHCYRRIMGCNIVIDMLDEVKGSDAEKGFVKGQALGLRAYFYFMLVNCFGLPYNSPDSDATQLLGVPLKITSVISDAYPERASVADVYKQIEEDLLEALPLMENYSDDKNKYKVTTPFILAMLSRMYLYMEDWENAEKYSSKALEINSSLMNFSDIPYPGDDEQPSAGVYGTDSPELIWFGYGGSREFNMFLQVYSFQALPPFTVSQDLKESYDSDLNNTYNRKDLRLRLFYSYTTRIFGNRTLLYGNRHISFWGGTSSFTVKGLRYAEVYLNRAEAYCQLYIKTGDESLRSLALKDLNYLRLHRYDTRNVPYENVNITEPHELLQFCRDERRRELAFEEHRWFDLRRYGMPRIEHIFQRSENDVRQTYVLEERGARYVLPLSTSVLNRNPKLVPNP